MTDAARIVRRAAIASASVAFALALLKAVAAWMTGSVAMLGSLADSALDVIASLATLIGVHIAAKPADSDHRFGHGKAEALAALFQVVVIAGSAIAILLHALDRLSSGQVAANTGYGIGVSVVAIAATLALGVYQRRVIARTGSIAITTDLLHYQSDVMLNGAVIAALLLDGMLGVRGADPLFGVAIALWLMWGAWRASVGAIDQLMDREWPDDQRRRFVAVAARHPACDNLHDLRTRTSGTRHFVQFHIAMPGHISITDAHVITESIESALEADFPDTEVLIHVDPLGQVDQPDNPMAEADEIRLLDRDTP